MRLSIGGRRLALGLLALSLVTAPAQAGFLDGIMGKIKGFFGGGKAKENEAFAQALERVEQSQQAVFEIEKGIIEAYNQGGVSPDDPQIQEALNQLADASRTNEDIYLEFLKGRGQAQEAGADLSAYEERMNAIQENQRRLEEGYQDIQDFNRESGFFEPPAEAGAGATVAEAGGPDPALGIEGFINDPRVQGYIDEWLAMNGLDEFGRKVGGVEGGVIKANYNPDTDGRTRHKYVWDHLWQKTGGGAVTLRQYVMDRLGGGTPGAAPPPSTGEPPAAQNPAPLQVATGTGDASVGEGLADRGKVASSADLAKVNKEYQETQTAIQQALARGEAGSVFTIELQNKLKKLEGQRNALIAQGAQ